MSGHPPGHRTFSSSNLYQTTHEVTLYFLVLDRHMDSLGPYLSTTSHTQFLVPWDWSHDLEFLRRIHKTMSLWGEPIFLTRIFRGGVVYSSSTTVLDSSCGVLGGLNLPKTKGVKKTKDKNGALYTWGSQEIKVFRKTRSFLLFKRNPLKVYKHLTATDEKVTLSFRLDMIIHHYITYFV